MLLTSLIAVSRHLTFIEAIIIHVSIHVQILSSHKGEFCFRMLIWSIIWVITERRNMLF